MIIGPPFSESFQRWLQLFSKITRSHIKGLDLAVPDDISSYTSGTSSDNHVIFYDDIFGPESTARVTMGAGMVFEGYWRGTGGAVY